MCVSCGGLNETLPSLLSSPPVITIGKNFLWFSVGRDRVQHTVVLYPDNFSMYLTVGGDRVQHTVVL